MFDISSLMSPTIRKQFDALDSISAQTVFLLHLLDYTQYFKSEADEISRYCKENDNTVIDTENFERVWIKKDFILKYARCVRSLNKVKKLINELCTDLLDKNTDNFDLILYKASSAFDIVQSIDDFEFIDKGASVKDDKPLLSKKEDTAKKKTLVDIMKYKALVVPPKPKKERKNK